MISVSDRKTKARSRGAILGSKVLFHNFFAIWIVIALSGCNASTGTTTVTESLTPPTPSPVYGPASPQGIESLVAKDEKLSLSTEQSNDEKAAEEATVEKETLKVEPKAVAESEQKEKQIYLAETPKPASYHQIGKSRTALLRAARKDSPELKGTLFYQPMIITDGQDACIISEAKSSPDAKPVYTIAQLVLMQGYWERWNIATTTDQAELAELIERELSDNSDQVETIAYRVAAQYQNINAEAVAIDSRASSSPDDSGTDVAVTTKRYDQISAEIDSLYASRMRMLESQIRLEAARREWNSSREIHVGYSYKPLEAENGSYYGEISERTFRPKTTYVSGYYRNDGTYVRSHYRSKPRR
jgi:hypothetical protein